MFDRFETAALMHARGPRHAGAAAFDVIKPEDFARAQREITSWPGYSSTPLVAMPRLATALGLARVDYKHEGPRFGLGSFKALGAAYAAQRALQRHLAKQGQHVSLEDIRQGRCRTDATLASATDGNHGRALAWGAQQFGAACRIYIHAEVSEMRAQAIRDLGATVVRINGDYDDSVRMCKADTAANGWTLVSDTSWPGYSAPPRDVMAGYGVMTQEVCAHLDRAPTHVFLQGGVGGLAASVAAKLRQIYKAEAPRVIIIEPDKAACLLASAKADALTEVAVEEETIMAGLSCGAPSDLAWRILREEATDFVALPDDLIAPAVRLLARGTTGDAKLEAGESAVAGLAALVAACQTSKGAAQLGLEPTSRVLLIGSEGVTDPEVFTQIMAEGLDG